MPKQRLRLTKTEDQENRIRLSRLEKMNIQIGPADDPPHEPSRLTVEPTEREARIYELPLGAVGVLVPAKIIVLKSVMITKVEMMIPWDDFPLDLSDPEENPNYKHLISNLPFPPPTVLNRLLTSNVPLRTHRVEGVIIAQGYSSVPSKYHDETLVEAELLLRDERCNELSFRFGVRLDRSLMHAWERQHREHRERAPWIERTGLFGPNRRLPVDQKGVSREADIKQPHVRGEYYATGNGGTPKIN